MPRTAVVIGATGLTGSNLVNLLLHNNAFDQVKVLLRKPTLKPRAGLESIIVDFEDENNLAAVLHGDVLFCCIGTTRRKAGSQEQFRQVDFNIPVRCATLAKRQGFGQFLLMSSVGANVHSRFFYLRTKGETEQAIIRLGFNSLHILRPSALLGKRDQPRLGSLVGQFLVQVFYFLLQGRWKKYRGIKASTVAKAMVAAAVKGEAGTHIYESDAIKEMAGEPL
ncbi:NAD(P)H-binding protein [Chitinophaga agrisoli]|uniref:NAD(P)H-binding protein n=1 Tax=Chitinophaga agrisoli TaxID=2607653 RepID=A0A5B2VP59_9BACT|nr:NAD(P)H-binding protein [Chitinophaga agrisoli]KAA2240166.1 NAD(P)H-binding protein [Chitinophaga agrisoli]